MKVKIISASRDLDQLEERINIYLDEYLKQGGNPEVYDVRLTIGQGSYIATITHR